MHSATRQKRKAGKWEEQKNGEEKQLKTTTEVSTKSSAGWKKAELLEASCNILKAYDTNYIRNLEGSDKIVDYW